MNAKKMKHTGGRTDTAPRGGFRLRIEKRRAVMDVTRLFFDSGSKAAEQPDPQNRIIVFLLSDFSLLACGRTENAHVSLIIPELRLSRIYACLVS